MTTIDTIQHRLGAALQLAGLADDQELATRIRDEGHRFVFLLNGLVRATRLYELDNQALDAPAAELAGVLSGLLDRLGAVHLVCVEDQVYVNDVRLRVRSSEQPVVDQLVADMGRHEAGGLSFHQGLDSDGWKRVAQALGSSPEGPQPARALLARLQDIADIEVSGRWRFRIGDDDRSGPQRYADVLGRAAVALREALGRLAAGRMPNPLPVRRAVIDLVESLESRPERAAAAPFAGPADLGGAERHLLSVCELSLMLGRSLGLSRAALSDLGVAAMFHDVGYLRPETRDSHALAGTRLLLRQRGFSEAKVLRLLAVLEHHADYLDMERDEPPSLFARILRLAEDYDLLIAPRSGPLGSLPPSKALATIWAGRAGRYDPILVALFAQALGMYPAGTLLELTDGCWAVAVGAGRDRARFAHPLVRRVREADGSLATASDPVDLFAQRAKIRARRIVDPALVTADVGGACRSALAEAVA